MRYLLSLVAFAACSSDPKPVTTPPPRAPDALRVASYNMNFGVAGEPAPGVDAIARTNADIVLLQETNAAWERAIASAPTTRFPEHRFADPAGRFAAGGMGVLSKYPIVALDRLEPTDGGFFFAFRIVVDAPGGRVQLLAVHLRPPMGDNGSWITGYLATPPIRAKELARHLAALDPALPTIIAGDFNEDAAIGQAIGHLRDLGYTDAVAEFHGNDHTWHWPIPGGELEFQLDHIFYDRRFAARASAILDAGNSDHLPVVADLARR